MYVALRKWKNIIIHHSASDFGNARLIKKWHVEQGWADIGYHFVVLNGYLTGKDLVAGRRFDSLVGAIECGRGINGDKWVQNAEEGAHALGYNRDSIGICMIHGSGQYCYHQLDSLLHLCEDLCTMFDIPPVRVSGHYEVNGDKPLCPGIDMGEFREMLEDGLHGGTV